MADKLAIAGMILVILLVAFAIIGMLAVDLVLPFTSEAAVSGVVTEKYIKRVGEVDKFFVVIENEDGFEILENTDVFLREKYKSANLQYEIEIGQAYTFRVISYRVPFLSMFRNILSMEAINGDRNTN